MATSRSTETQWLTDQERETWVRLVAVTELLPGLLDSQLRRDAQLTHFEYFVLAMLSEAKDLTLRMTSLANLTSATLPRLSHVVRRLEDKGLVRRTPCPEDKRASNAVLTEAGQARIRDAAPGHVTNVRENVFDALTAEQVEQLHDIADALLVKLDPHGRLTALYAPDTTEPEAL
ncbi:MarR family transcriptional regulator [Nocardioides sp. JQ2195]|uniref:MarR family winged helix-turn-helix transcriptional regulator n=1 Tax=Nocardioides sp. JQ2195 TaxID=2592334 RepID=UPI00143EE76C|nr:MarR family transcriptional regulator [Nocardioides sp. JQ2195]QIX27251.1 MarR family transcriptional regulator [Nocardioides sp. JQ2195]